MGAGFSDVSGSDGGHVGTTQAITVLGVPSFTTTSYENMIQAVLNVWDAPSGFTNLGQVTDGGVNAGASQASGGHLGDIRVAAWEISAVNVLAHAFQPGTQAIFGAGGTVAGDLHVDINWIWADDPTDGGDPDIDLYTVLLHEFGHALGLGHSSVPGSVMEPVYAGARRTLHADDIAGIQALYGVVPEPAGVVLLGAFALVALQRRRRRAA
jgi:hypothetical protein